MLKLFFFLFFLLLPFFVLAEDENPTLRLELARANLYLKTNEQEKAFSLLRALKTQYPNNKEVLEAEANAYLDAGYRGRGLESLDGLSRIDPDSAEVKQLQEQVTTPDYPYAAIEENTRYTGDGLTEHLTRLSGSTRYQQHLSFGAVLERDQASVGYVTRINGVSAPFNGVTSRGEIYGSYNLDNGDQSTLSLFGAEDTLGLGAWHSWFDRCGITDIELLAQRPDWEFIEEVVDRGRRDKVRLTRTQILTPRFRITGSAALNRYGIGDDYNVANSPSFYADANYLLPPIPAVNLAIYHASLQFDYAIDAEYPFYVERKTDSEGFLFTPLPLETREVHSVTLTFNHEVNNDVSYQIYGGYAYDRFGGKGPLSGAYVTWWLMKQLALEGNAFHSIRKETTSQAENNIGAKLRWMF